MIYLYCALIAFAVNVICLGVVVLSIKRAMAPMLKMMKPMSKPSAETIRLEKTHAAL